MLAAEILEAVWAAGVRTICLCPGGRNAALVMACQEVAVPFDVLSFFEERSAGFFALGRMRRDGVPVAVITTSGTAAAALLPAMLEAYHAGLPLLAITADRPHRLRGTGAPQTIDQLPLFAAAQTEVRDIDGLGQIGTLSLQNEPLHLNISFEEFRSGESSAPMNFGAVKLRENAAFWMDESAVFKICDDFFRSVKTPLVLVSSLNQADAEALAPWLEALECPLYLEAISQLRARADLQKFSLRAGEKILLAPQCREACDGIVRIGGIPTPRFWRECENEKRPMLHISRVNFPGLPTREPVVPLPLFLRVADNFRPQGGSSTALFRRDAAIAQQLEQLLAEEPLSEAGLIRALAKGFSENARIFLGNSLPLREWDLAAPRTGLNRLYFANRGVNGIDGLVSTSLGLAGGGRPLAAVLGDLSALYDLAGLWPVAQLSLSDICIAVINNGGGKIFDRLYGHPAFFNTHQLRLRGWAEMFGWSYAEMRLAQDFVSREGPRIVEVLPDAEATRRFTARYSELWS